ncbi:DNA alkylation repair protein [Pseudohongiella acticola]|uniref:DNA alkylation repair protein n=1 Tax=Pseudohongiella acticola TaxID=1524254 RepID=A0A1E8CJL3_9GAMM|nr:DNA alkylation repair protein [Pseudohongiella acticola]OFE12589.1 DNA alkylation repair protein [Pseudohongiella acticola]
MAEPLKNQYGPEIAHRIADMISATYPSFRRQIFLDYVLTDYDSLELMPRGWHMADGLFHALPDNYAEAIDILLASLPTAKPAVSETSPTQDREGGSLAPFLFMPHTFFVARYGLADFETSMRAQYELTQRFTAEFSIRPFLQQQPEATLKRLQNWVNDPSEHVRRLVSEGTRPRLPWASRLPAFQRDPAPVLALLEQLRDDDSLYVRRSVANNLNDIGKDHPLILLSTAENWFRNASVERKWIVRHALRNQLKEGQPRALAIFGFKSASNIGTGDINIQPGNVNVGERVKFSATLTNNSGQRQMLLIDFKVHFVKANGAARAKVFKLTQTSLDSNQSVTVSKHISLAPMTTRKLYAGKHQIELLINGQPYPLGAFNLNIPATT